MSTNRGRFAGLELIDGSSTVKPDAGKVLIHGPQGSGKSRFASSIAMTGKTLYIDLPGEKGVRAFQGDPWAKNIDVIRPESITDFDKLFYTLAEGDHEYDAVVIDSITSLQKMAMRYLLGHSETAVREIRQGTAPADLQTWGRALDIMTDTATFWFGLADGDREKPMHVIMTAQTKVSENEVTGVISRQPDVQRGAMQIMNAAPDYVMYADFEASEDFDDEGEVEYRHVVRFGADPEYRTKGRVPRALRGKMPKVLGRKSEPTLGQLARVLGWGGATASKKKTSAKKAGGGEGGNAAPATMKGKE